jgi:hypothetical protein
MGNLISLGMPESAPDSALRSQRRKTRQLMAAVSGPAATFRFRSSR